MARYFGGLGLIAFGGPAAHIAMMRRDLVARRKWLSDADFVDLMGVTALIPGPNSTELTMAIGGRRAGGWGLWLAGLAFILPAVMFVLLLAWAYVEYGATPAGEGIIWAIQAVVMAVVLQAIWGLRGAAFKSIPIVVVAVGVAALALAGVEEVFLILGAGAAMAGWYWLRRGAPAAASALAMLIPFAGSRPPGYANGELFLVFLKIGSLLFGSGYVLLAFLRTELVENRQWLTEEQVVDAIAAGQFTPGPLFSSATFAGYLLGGFPGAAVATAGIFLPSFLLVSAALPLALRLRRWPAASAFLDGVNAAALALMTVVTVLLARETLDDARAIVLFAVAAVILLRFNPHTALVVVAGAALGVAFELAERL